MWLRLVVISLLTVNIVAFDNRKFILDYFLHKKAAKIAGFSCNRPEEDHEFVKDINKKDIGAIIGSARDTSIINFLKSKYYKLGVYLDLRCNDALATTRVMSEATLGKLYSELHYWLVLSDDLENATPLIQDERFGLWTDFVVAIEKPNNGYELYDFYNPRKVRSGKLNVTYLGSWQPEIGFNIILTQSKYRRRHNLHGMTWRVSFYGATYRMKNQTTHKEYFQDYYKTGARDGLSKFGYSLVDHLAEMHNASMHLNEYSVWRKEDRLGPLTNALYHEETDFSGTPISVSSYRLSFVKLVYASWPFRTCFIFRSPQPSDIKVHEVLSPLSVTVWHLYYVVAILCILILGITLRLEHMESSTVRWSNSVLLTIGCLCQQGTNMKMEFFSTRIAFFFIMIFSLLIYNYYSASVVAARLNEQIFKLNDSMDSLAETDLEVASEPMIYFDFFMKQSPQQTEKFLKQKWEVIPKEKRFMSPEKGMRLVKDGGFAYHTHPDIGYPYINRFYDNREICELTEVHLATRSIRATAVGYNSSFFEMSKIGFLWMSEVGIRKRQLARWTSKRPHCRTDILSASSTTINEFAPHLILLVIGMKLSLMIFTIEVFVPNRSRNRFELFMKLQRRKMQ